MLSDGYWCGDGGTSDVKGMVNDDVTGAETVVVAGAVADPGHRFRSL